MFNAYCSTSPATVRLLLIVIVISSLAMVSGQAIAEGPPDRIMNLKADFGAVGDGEADDTDALQAAFDTRASVFIPEGTYRFTKTLYARSSSNIYGSGGGWNPNRQTHLLYDGPEGEGYKWWPAEGVVSGHPGHRIDSNVRYVFPASSDGITLYVDSDKGDDDTDGCTPEQAWRSLQKVADLFRDCTVDTPFTVIVSGQQPVNADFANINGAGEITLKPAAAARLGVLTTKNVGCRFVLAGSSKVQLGELRIDNCDNIRVNGVDFADGCETGTRLGVWGGSNAVVSGCRFAADGNQANAGIAAHENSRVFVQENAFYGILASDRTRTSTGAVIHAR